MTAPTITPETIIGELVKFTTDALKAAQEPWQKLSESKQDAEISRLTMNAEYLLNQVFDLVIGQDYIHAEVFYDQMTLKDGVKINLTTPVMNDALYDISTMRGKKILLLVADPEVYFGTDRSAIPRASPDQTELLESDPLLESAVLAVRENNRATISFLQRNLGIGYNRAARLLETMEADGFLGPIQADGSRKIIVHSEQEE
ncbi:MAG: hypothetical protein MJA28_06265 [Gammaproteobacteria bacterium]|nr:hypothetical protein [Gammaproteobacteria bacterium]